jgi:hypothetical protein
VSSSSALGKNREKEGKNQRGRSSLSLSRLSIIEEGNGELEGTGGEQSRGRGNDRKKLRDGALVRKRKKDTRERDDFGDHGWVGRKEWTGCP